MNSHKIKDHKNWKQWQQLQPDTRQCLIISFVQTFLDNLVRIYLWFWPVELTYKHYDHSSHQTSQRATVALLWVPDHLHHSAIIRHPIETQPIEFIYHHLAQIMYENILNNSKGKSVNTRQINDLWQDYYSPSEVKNVKHPSWILGHLIILYCRSKGM